MIDDKKRDDDQNDGSRETKGSDKRKEKILLHVEFSLVNQIERLMIHFGWRHQTFSPILTALYLFEVKSEIRLRTSVMIKRMAPTPKRAW
jgi:hypothetical protein